MFNARPRAFSEGTSLFKTLAQHMQAASKPPELRKAGSAQTHAVLMHA
jgi:hypothetical protein